MTFGIKHLLLPFSIQEMIIGSSPTLQGFPILPDSRNHEAAREAAQEP